jgi:hypothetical protein
MTENQGRTSSLKIIQSTDSNQLFVNLHDGRDEAKYFRTNFEALTLIALEF